MKDGRWTYECDDFQGVLAQHNPVIIEYDSNSGWELKRKRDGFQLDYQYTTPGTVCIDHNGVAWDKPGDEYYDDREFMSGTMECLDTNEGPMT